MAKANVLRLRAVCKNESKKRIYTATDRKWNTTVRLRSPWYPTPGLPVMIRDEIPEPELYALPLLPGRLSPDRPTFARLLLMIAAVKPGDL